MLSRTSVSQALGLPVVSALALVLTMLLALSGCSAATPEAPPPLRPLPEQARQDNGDLYARGCSSGYKDPEVHPCVFDDSAAEDSPVVVAVGDSKVAQWMPALQELATRHHWKLISMTKSGCPFSEIHRQRVKGEYTSCVTWNDAALEQVKELKPDLLVTTQFPRYPALVNGRRVDDPANREELVRGLSARISAVQDAGIPVATIAETPIMGFNTPACVQQHPDDLDLCARPRAEVTADSGLVAAAAGRSGAPVVDLIDDFCTETTCPAVRDGYLLYRDDHHTTATFIRTLAPDLAAGLTSGLETGLSTRLLGP
ncbi:SGNH hydrolase domain-containing protein [Kineosporia succinea]|uniref:Hemolysin n=1 Tax=Kineosporia succinea TaxID=84632 RepID=A0ABT9NVY6_9ACTN|nr:SGNH hydrolase domain-containing protein [Kineosporia succinea]MDP9824588.1 putative hemolysin [Kineosporia succinea]